MVESIVAENGEASPARKCRGIGIPSGNYRLVGWDMDATGKKHVDEMCQIAGYTPTSSYSQYVMPYKNLSAPARKRHKMTVVTIGKFRVLKSSKTNRVVKTKSEISALTHFLSWLESVKGDATDGVILVYHEPRKVIPAILLESLIKYDLLDRFKEVVKGFLNGFGVAEVKCANTVCAFSIRTLSRTLLHQQKQLDNARNRACLALQIVEHLSSLESTKGDEETTNGRGDGDVATKNTVDFIREFVQPVQDEEREYAELKVVFERQNSLRPIFDALFCANRRERQHASPLRRMLAEAGIEYLQLQEAWTTGRKEGLERLIKEKLTTAEEKKVQDLLIVLEGHFDPDKKSKLKILQEKKPIKTESRKINNNDKDISIRCCDSSTESLDTTISGSPLKLKSESSESSGVISAEN